MSSTAAGWDAGGSCSASRVQPIELMFNFSDQQSMQNQLTSTVPCFHPVASSSYDRCLASRVRSPWNGPWNTFSQLSHLYVPLPCVSFRRVSKMMAGIRWRMLFAEHPLSVSRVHALLGRRCAPSSTSILPLPIRTYFLTEYIRVASSWIAWPSSSSFTNTCTSHPPDFVADPASLAFGRLKGGPVRFELYENCPDVRPVVVLGPIR